MPIALAIVQLGFASALWAQTYSVTDLGTLGGNLSAAASLNNAGQVAGSSTTASGATHAFLYGAGAMTDLGTLPGGTSSAATAINDLGQVVGYGGINEFGPEFREFTQGFLWRGGSMRSLGALFCPCSFNQRYGTSAAQGINGAAQVVGDSGTVRGESVRHAFLWQDSVMQDLDTVGGSSSISFAYAINAAGQIAGQSDGHASLWQGGTRQDLGTLPGRTSSVARALNAAAQVVGESKDGNTSRAFLWQSGVMSELGTLAGDVSSQANSINATGQVVGWSGATDGSTSRAFYWQGDAMTDLNRLIPAGSGWSLITATGINDVGQIVGTGLHNGQTRAFLLTPLAGGVSGALVAAVLPSSRSVQVGTAATAFATVINTTGTTATGCALSLGTSIPAPLTFQTTDPASNQLTGTPNEPVAIPAGQSQSFMFALTPTAPIASTDVRLGFHCDQNEAAVAIRGVNTLLFTSSLVPTPDIIALAATPDDNGIVTLAGPNGTGAFAVAIVNVGSAGGIIASADTGAGALPASLSLCPTNAETGQCATPPAATVALDLGPNATATLSIFVTANGPLPFDPANNRVFVSFKDGGGVVRGATSVALRSQ